jgi:hypothetical protein
VTGRATVLGIVLVLLVGWSGGSYLWAQMQPPPAPRPPVKAARPGRVTVGYFHGGRTGIAFRTYVNGYYEVQGVGVDYVTTNLNEDSFFVLPHDAELVLKMKHGVSDSYTFGKIGGEQLMDDVVKGELDGACVGEASFLTGVEKGMPIVAVCSLGHDRRGMPGHAIIFRKGVEIRSPSDLKGKILVSRRAGPGDETMLREFLRSEGLDPDKDVTLRSNVDDNECVDALLHGEVDGGYYHLMALRDLVEMGEAWIYRPLDWVNPEVAQSLLIFRKDFVETHRSEVQAMVRAIVRRSYDEARLSIEERSHGGKGLRIDMEFEGLNLPGSDIPPYVRRDMLVLMQGLLIKNKFLPKRVDIDPYIDNSLVREAWQDLSQRMSEASSKRSR